MSPSQSFDHKNEALQINVTGENHIGHLSLLLEYREAVPTFLVIKELT